MPIMSMRDAINDAMRRDASIILIGEDVAGGRGCPNDADGEAAGGVMGVTAGLYREFGAARVIDTPITESAIMGAAAGAALTGLRPIAELMFADFFGVCFDQLYNQAAKFRYMFGGQRGAPMVVRTMVGAGMGAGPQHSQAIYPIFAHIPGLKVVLPSNAYDAKGLLIQSIRDNDPVMFCEHKVLYQERMEVPEESYCIPFGEARTVCEGEDVTLVALGRMVGLAEQAAKELTQENGIAVSVLDPRSLSPLDTDTILDSVAETGRAVIVDEATPICSMASEIASVIVSDGFSSLRAPVKKVTAPHTPVPASPQLEAVYTPSVPVIKDAVKSVYTYR